MSKEILSRVLPHSHRLNCIADGLVEGATGQTISKRRQRNLPNLRLCRQIVSIHNPHLTWAQWCNDSAPPGVLRNKWFERRHTQHPIKRFPWGNQMPTGLCNTGDTTGITVVKAFPAGRSPFCCYVRCGNSWQWTESERRDGRTRFCILKGDSWFKAQGSGWYPDDSPQPCGLAAKFLLMWPGLDRCSTVGFRCAVDLA